MLPDERIYAYLWDMREACQLIMRFLENISYEQYSTDKLVQSAVERQLMIIGEAARRIPFDYQETHPDLPWKKLIGLRNILTHEYGEIKQDRIWLIVKKSVPKLFHQLKSLIPPVE